MQKARTVASMVNGHEFTMWLMGYMSNHCFFTALVMMLHLKHMTSIAWLMAMLSGSENILSVGGIMNFLPQEKLEKVTRMLLAVSKSENVVDSQVFCRQSSAQPS